MNNSFNSLKSMWKGAAMKIAEGYRDATQAKQIDPSQEKHAKKGSVRARQAGQGTKGRHYVRHERQGPFHRQIGVKHTYSDRGHITGTGRIMQTFYVLRVLHATKGWRAKTFPTKTELL